MKVLLAIDDSACSEAATQAVIAQFRPQDTAVCVVHAVHWDHIVPISLQFARGAEVAGAYQALRERTSRDAEALVVRAKRQLQNVGFSTTTMVQEGEPQRVVLDCAAGWHPDVIVLGSHGKKGIDRLMRGSVSDTIVRQAACSVEVVRAPGRRSREHEPIGRASSISSAVTPPSAVLVAFAVSARPQVRPDPHRGAHPANAFLVAAAAALAPRPLHRFRMVRRGGRA
jgi:nucleotide-binding universal stress UspA family protein